jgi:hypothetical protein
VLHRALVARHGDLSVADISIGEEFAFSDHVDIRVAQRARSAVRAVWVRGVLGKPSCACGRSACSRRPVYWSTRRVARYKRLHRLVEEVFPAVQLVASVGRGARSSGRGARVEWPQQSVALFLMRGHLAALRDSDTTAFSAHISKT